MAKMSMLDYDMAQSGIDTKGIDLDAIWRLQRRRQITDLQACELQVQTEEWQSLKRFAESFNREKDDV